MDESIRDGTDTFIIDALLPVVESFGLVNDLRKQTSGSATCQLSFACWELMESDPFVSQTLKPQLYTLHAARCTLHTKFLELIRSYQCETSLPHRDSSAPALFSSDFSILSQWVPSTEEEKEDFDQSDIDNVRGAARLCMDFVRKRKGLPVQEKLVAAAEKQRTRSKRK